MLPDGVTYTKGFVKYPEQVRRYLALTDGDGDGGGDLPSSPSTMIAERPQDRKTVDLTKNVHLFGILLFS